ncbi:MAG: hypothetical protein ACRC75_00060 [Olsenella sp.]
MSTSFGSREGSALENSGSACSPACGSGSPRVVLHVESERLGVFDDDRAVHPLLNRREAYLRKIRPFYCDDMIKVITGIRRCGKSYLLLSIQDELRGGPLDGSPIIG